MVVIKSKKNAVKVNKYKNIPEKKNVRIIEYES